MSGTATRPRRHHGAVHHPHRRLPAAASRSGSTATVMLDWVNVTAQFENAVDTLEAREMLLREGWAFVHVSAQKAGLCCYAADAEGLRPGAVRRDQPPRRRVRRRHVQPGRPGDAVAPGRSTR